MVAGSYRVGRNEAPPTTPVQKNEGGLTMRQRIVLLIFYLVLPGIALGQDVEVGDIVQLEERDIHIPAHPGPGDSDVTFRFAGGSTAHVLAVDSASGWLEIRGEEVGGGERNGWITRKYVERVLDGTSGGGSGIGTVPAEPPLELAWCPPAGSPAPHPSGRLRIATWNLGNLHAQDGGSTFIGSDPSVKRFPLDYERIRCYVRMVDPDVLAVQEVDGEEALRRVVDEEVYEVHVSSRPLAGGMGGRQNTGFAYKKGLAVQELPDFTELDVSGGLRHGARIDLTHGTTILKLMSVHLKSGCFANANSGSACNRLFQQVPVLETWIDAAAMDDEPFLVLGDFNRRLNQPEDVVWTNLDDADPANADLTAVTEDRPIGLCRTDQPFVDFIDHVVADKRAGQWVDRSSFRNVPLRQQDREVWDRISDHCPVVVELWLP